MQNNVSSVSVENFNGIPIISYNAVVGENYSKIELNGKNV